MLALRRMGCSGLAFVDGHLEFRHPGNSSAIGSAAGDDLALVAGRGMADLTSMEGLRPLVRDEDVMAISFRSGDEYAAEAQTVGITVLDVAHLRRGASDARHAAIAVLEQPGLAGFWIHLDADVLDAAIMPAVDSPEPGGITFGELVQLTQKLNQLAVRGGPRDHCIRPDLDQDAQRNWHEDLQMYSSMPSLSLQSPQWPRCC